MRLTEEVTALLYQQAEELVHGRGRPGRRARGALASIAALYDEHAPLLRAIVEVSTYDERGRRASGASCSGASWTRPSAASSTSSARACRRRVPAAPPPSPSSG